MNDNDNGGFEQQLDHDYTEDDLETGDDYAVGQLEGEDYTEDDRWDWDQSDESQYCEHGTFIGSWWGPDLLCGWCEDGTSREEYEAYLERQRLEQLRKMALPAAFELVYPTACTFRHVASREQTSAFFAETLETVRAMTEEELRELVG